MRISYSESIEDVIHPRFSVEVKYGKQIPKYCRVKEAVLYYSGDDAYIVFPSSEIELLEGYNEEWDWAGTRTKDCRFIQKGLEQASAYNKDKIALLCMKSKSMRGIVLAMYYGDWLNLGSLP